MTPVYISIGGQFQPVEQNESDAVTSDGLQIFLVKGIPPAQVTVHNGGEFAGTCGADYPHDEGNGVIEPAGGDPVVVDQSGIVQQLHFQKLGRRRHGAVMQLHSGFVHFLTALLPVLSGCYRSAVVHNKGIGKIAFDGDAFNLYQVFIKINHSILLF